MTAPTNSLLVTICSEVEGKITPDTDVYMITAKYVVKKGTDVQQLLVDQAQGKFQPPNPPDLLTVGMCIKDISQVQH